MALQVARDADGLLWMADPETGTLMVDTGNPLTGILAVTPDGDMYNFFTDSVTGKVRPWQGYCYGLVQVRHPDPCQHAPTLGLHLFAGGPDQAGQRGRSRDN